MLYPLSYRGKTLLTCSAFVSSDTMTVPTYDLALRDLRLQLGSTAVPSQARWMTDLLEPWEVIQIHHVWRKTSPAIGTGAIFVLIYIGFQFCFSCHRSILVRLRVFAVVLLVSLDLPRVPPILVWH